MTNVMVQTESTAPNRRAWTFVDGVENVYMHLVRFLYGAWTSPYVWVIFAIAVMAQPTHAPWETWVRNLLIVAFLFNFGRLWQWHNQVRKDFVKSTVAAKNQGVAS